MKLKSRTLNNGKFWQNTANKNKDGDKKEKPERHEVTDKTTEERSDVKCDEEMDADGSTIKGYITFVYLHFMEKKNKYLF